MSPSPRELANWRAEHLRFSVFLQEPLADISSAWRTAVGEEPEIDENRPKEGIRHQVGPFAGGNLDMSGSAARVDFVLLGIPSESPPGIQDIPTALTAFNDAVLRWLASTAPKIVRMAFGGAFLLPADNREDAYQRLGELVDCLTVDPAVSKEVLYRVNRPTQSTASPELGSINRMMTWSTILSRSVLIGIIGSGPNLPALAEHHFLRLELDYNTPAERTRSFEADKVAAIYEELVQLAVTTVTRGESA